MKIEGPSAAVLVCASTFCAAAHAQSGTGNSGTTVATPPPTYYYSPASRIYAGVDVGGGLTGDSQVKEFFGSVAPDTKIKFDPGVRVGLHGGYQLTDWLGLEGETGVIANNIKSITGATIDGTATFANVPFLANARLTLPTHSRCPVRPYIGGGLGGSASTLSLEHHIDLDGTRLSGSDSTVVFAYQAFAGLRYALNDKMGVGVEYHYFATTGADWKADSSSGTATDHLKFRGVESHLVSLAFDYHF